MRVLKPIEEAKETYDILEARLKRFWKEHFYIPLLKELNVPIGTLKNASLPAKKVSPASPTARALQSGKITYYRGAFSGKFNAEISKELKALGASYDRRDQSFRIPIKELTPEIKAALAQSDLATEAKMVSLRKALLNFDTAEFARKFKSAPLFDVTLKKADQDFRHQMKGISVGPELTASQRAKIATDWQENMQLWIKDWTKEQITDLRQKIFEQVTSGARPKSLIPPILKVTQTVQKSYDQAVNKAKFLAHQETRLLMAKFKEVRYTDAGLSEYIWRCVHRTHDANPEQHTKGNVRYSHGLLDGKVFRWDDPPVTSNPGEPVRRNNPGQDYNCRCHARPILRSLI